MPVDVVLEEKVAACCRAGDVDAAADALVRGYGGEIYSFLLAKMGDEVAAADAFSLFSENVWRGLGGFRGDASLRTWAYCVARRAAAYIQRGELARRERIAAGESAAERAAAHVRTTTAVFKRTEVKQRLRAIREQLSEEDQELLTLRVDRRLDWREIARVLLDDDASAEEIKRQAAQLRKRFERAKERLRHLARASGLLEEA